MVKVGPVACSGVKSGKLVALAAFKFDAANTVDKKLPYHQNTSSLPVAVALLDSLSNELSYLPPSVPAPDGALENLQLGSDLLPRSEVERGKIAALTV